MTIGAAGGIWQGTGTFAAPTTGLKIWNDEGHGRIATFDGGVQRVTMRHDRGIEIANAAATFVSAAAISFAEGAGGQIYGVLRGRNTGVTKHVLLGTDNQTENSTIEMRKTLSGADVILSAGLISLGIDTISDRAFTNRPLHISGGIFLSNDLSTSGGPLPPTGVLRMKERTSAVGTPPAGTADLYILKRNNKQELYIKFADGSGFTLATSTA